MGVIYLAHDPLIDRKVAIKLIRADLLHGEDRADYLARFRREAQAAGRCAHSNIVAIYDLSVHDGNPYLAMEYVEARNLSQVLSRSGPFQPPAAVHVISQVLAALACAHGFGIVHRDVKPGNILLLGDLRVKMTDFGISRIDTSGLTQAGSIIGTPRYMSPEQCCGDPVDARSDLFSTGVVLYELISGTSPFAGDTPTAIAFRIMNEPPRDLRTLRADVPAALVAVVERSLAKKPVDRFASADEMAVALKQAINLASTVVATPDQTTVPTRAPAVFPEATLTALERKLTQHVGPIARILVQSAARRANSIEELHDIVSSSIDHPEQRTRFRQGLGSETSGRRGGAVTPAMTQQAERELTALIGPIARILVKRALEATKSADDFWQRLGTHIERDADRQAFLNRHRS